MSRASLTGTAYSGPAVDWPYTARETQLGQSTLPLELPPQRFDSGLVCEACTAHIDIDGRCRCS